MISRFISSYSFCSLFIKTNSSWTIFESIKDLEIKTSMLFNLDFANSTFLSCFFYFFLIIDLDILIPAASAHIFNPIAELVIPVGIPKKESKAEAEMHPLTAETKIRTYSIYFRAVKTFLCLQNKTFAYKV